ncbi:MAG: DNA repair and recombination protein RadB [Methanocorpusculum sp.]|jgi:DNA repair protein RadB|uniref:DNA repair and recombination protein RadB n=1 Tax=Methanocorpusculum parvum TaxID=2193 RepID=A0AAX0Q7E3_9EURY|nr:MULTISPECIES: DNA repair and recombination protein RadB [Methanocorpusculum]MDD2248435.1 DNA repair and recombination protein RadB [Methanocorpusculum sp.]MDD2803469.1 DNA repair and recombination protein RadB [Methanocorpusculum sp.]MDD3047591.1 DNA repair and recombination protein RadB [Methanocorpusculum sp.]MDD3912805.1 DNA repair and recombination protein RadB [Methanocorpusculum sp.]MDD4424023.1 DNA repair and recombination protein RadB [Methanocorpusculum parvum]
MEDAVKKLPTGAFGLDSLLGGGIEPRMITQFFGEAGSGKSTLCLMAAVELLRSGRGVVYIDSEGFSIERFSQIAGDSTNEFAQRLFVFEPSTFAEQGLMISESERLIKSGAAGMIVVDSATALYRVEQTNTKDALSMLSRQMMVLLGIAKRYDIPAVITNQVFMDIDHHRLSGLGGTALSHISKAIVRVEKHEGFRRAVLFKHRSQAEGTSWDFVLTGTGAKDRQPRLNTEKTA